MEDAAKDPRCESVVQAFLRAKDFTFLPYAARLQEKILEEAGILERGEMLHAMERIYSEYQLEQAKKNVGQRD